MRAKASNLTDLIDRLDDREQAFLCRTVNLYGNTKSPIHIGSLVFLNKDTLFETLNKVISGQTSASTLETSCAKKVMNKLGQTYNDGRQGVGPVSFEIYLNSTKLFRWARKTQNTLTIRLPFKTTKEVGMQWQEFGKKWIPGKEDVYHHASLVRVARDLWKVEVNRTLELATKQWLFEKFR